MTSLLSKPLKIQYQGCYDGYQYSYQGVEFVVFNGSYNSTADWYIVCDILSERETDGSYATRKQALANVTRLIDRSI